MGSPSDEFKGLRSILKLKTYEHPPSRFFDGLSEDVLDRLRGPEGLRQQSLLRSLGYRFGVKPALFYALGALCSAAAFYGVVSLLGKPPVAPAATTDLRAGPDGTASEPNLRGGGSGFLASGVAAEVNVVSTNPVLSPGGLTCPIDPFKVHPTPANYQPR
jgi:hypothetical protein